MPTKGNEAILDEYEKTRMADMYGLPKDFIERNNKSLQEINKMVSGYLANYGYGANASTGSNPMEDLNNIIRTTIKSRGDAGIVGAGDSTSQTGIRGIQLDSVSLGEQDIISSFSKLTQTSFALMGEYRQIVNFIPEIQRVISIMARDILNRDEFTKRAIKNPYKDSTLSKTDLERMNKQIDEKIINRYGLEQKIRNWVEASLTEGAHPVAVFPYSQILEQIIKIPEASVRVTKENGSLVSFDITKKSAESLYEPHIFGKESTLSREAYEYKELYATTRNAIESIIDDDFADELFDETMEMFEERVHHIQRNTDSFTAESDIIDAKALDKIRTMIDKSEEETRRLHIRQKVAPLVEIFDSNIEVVDGSKASALIARRELRQRKKVCDGVNMNGNTPIGNDIIELTAPGIRDFDPSNPGKKKEEPDSILDKYKKSDLYKEVLLIEYDPEAVIPVIIGGQHVGYYVIEYDAFYGSEWKARKRIGSFTDIAKSVGFGNDAAMVSSINSIADTDPLTSNMFTPMPIMAGSQMMMNNTGQMEEDRRVETLKRIAMNTMAHRLKDPSVVDDKNFRDAVMNLMRNGYLLKKKIMITYIPASHMVYFAHKLDTNGLPVSILDGTLMTLYMYVSSKISSLMLKLMKSSDKEKLLVNMGMTRQLNYTLSEIEKSLSTRNIHVSSLFSNVGQVVRNASTFQRVKIPVVDGEQLYDLQAMERTADMNPDDEYTDKLLMSALMKIGVPPSFTNTLSENEYSKSLSMQNLDYRANIMDKQSVYEADLSKLIRLIGSYTNISIANEESENKKDAKRDRAQEIKFDASKVDVTLTVPTFLTVSNMSEQIQTAQTLVESFTRIISGDNDENSLTKSQKNILELELYKIFANSVDWTHISRIYNDVKRGRVTGMLSAKADAQTAELADQQQADTAEGTDDMSSGDTGGGGDDGGGFGDDNGGAGGGDDFASQF